MRLHPCDMEPIESLKNVALALPASIVLRDTTHVGARLQIHMLDFAIVSEYRIASFLCLFPPFPTTRMTTIMASKKIRIEGRFEIPIKLSPILYGRGGGTCRIGLGAVQLEVPRPWGQTPKMTWWKQPPSRPHANLPTNIPEHLRIASPS